MGMNTDEILTATVNETVRITGLGTTKIREMIANGLLESVVIEGRRLVVIDSYRRLLKEALTTRQPPRDARRNKAGAIPAAGARRAG
jgi:hypothetical protein